MRPRGIGEIPLQHTVRVIDSDGKEKNIQSPLDPQLRRVLVDMREQLLQIRQRQTVPDAPTNLKATGQAFSNLIQWTRSSDADYYEVLHALTPALTDPHLQTTDVGNSALWIDHVGQTAIKKFYWVRARKRTGASSLEIGPVNATTVASATGVNPPTPPPPSNILVTDRSTGRVIPYTLTSPRSFRL
jgi:hypothetical protein